MNNFSNESPSRTSPPTNPSPGIPLGGLPTSNQQQPTISPFPFSWFPGISQQAFRPELSGNIFGANVGSQTTTPIIPDYLAVQTSQVPLVSFPGGQLFSSMPMMGILVTPYISVPSLQAGWNPFGGEISYFQAIPTLVPFQMGSMQGMNYFPSPVPQEPQLKQNEPCQQTQPLSTQAKNQNQAPANENEVAKSQECQVQPQVFSPTDRKKSLQPPTPLPHLSTVERSSSVKEGNEVIRPIIRPTPVLAIQPPAFSKSAIEAQKVLSIASFVPKRRKIRKWRLEYLSELRDFIVKLFKDEPFEAADLPSDPHHIQILQSIASRKLIKSVELSVESEQARKKSVEMLQRVLQAQRSPKRPEENSKFIFKRVLRYFKEEIRAECPELDRRAFHHHFYETYFGEVARREGLPLENFYNPMDSRHDFPGVKGPKTISLKYISLLRRSQHFVNSFLDYLENRFERDYVGAIDKKISRLFRSWEIKVYKHKKAESLEAFCHYIDTNNKCKLPWTLVEVREAVRWAKSLFKEL